MQSLSDRLPGSEALITWMVDNESLLAAVFLASLLAFVLTLIAVPVIIARLPADHFLPGERPPRFWRELPAWARPVLLGLKNAVGYVFLIFGIIMLAIPGQGLVTILIGLSLIDFPGKHRLERRLIAQPTIHRAVTWIRRRAGREPFVLD